MHSEKATEMPLKHWKVSSKTLRNSTSQTKIKKPAKKSVQNNKKALPKTERLFGRGRRIRTLGTRFWRPLLYQLSYAPMRNAHRIAVGAALELLGRFELPTSSLPRMRSTD